MNMYAILSWSMKKQLKTSFAAMENQLSSFIDVEFIRIYPL